jgi:tRNA A58 N-methylase Trm61
VDQTKSFARELLDVLPYLFLDEPEYFTQLGKDLPNHASVACLGAGPGLMSLFLLEANPTLRIIAVDFNHETVRTYKAHLNAANFSSSVYIGRTIDPIPLENNYPDYIPLDLLIIDADHSEQAVIEDCSLWFPYVKKGSGLVYFHDFIDLEKNGSNGVAKAVEYLCTKGVLSKGSAELIAEPGISRVYRKVK